MKTILYTQRVEIVESYGERRDCADQNIPMFLEECGYLPVPVPNMLKTPGEFVAAIRPAGILLTGGNSLVKYGGNAPERDRTDRVLLEIAERDAIPVYGFCRGMQSILDYFGCELKDVKGHVAVRHTVSGVSGTLEVNSYHNQGCFQVKAPLEVLARAVDGVIEAVCCRERQIVATMWHPEREKLYAVSDIQRVRALFR